MLRCLLHSLAVWVAEQLTNCPQETNGHMVWVKVPYKAIKGICSFDTEVLLLGPRRIFPSGNGHFVMFSQSDQMITDWLPHTPSTWNYFPTRGRRRRWFPKHKFSCFGRFLGFTQRGHKINVKGHEMFNRIRKQKKMKNWWKTHTFSREGGRCWLAGRHQRKNGKHAHS